MNVFLIPIVAIVFGIGIAALAMWTDHKRKMQLLEQQHRERMAALEKGIALPPLEFAAAGKKPDSPDPARVLRSGVLLLSMGIVLYFAIDASGGGEGALFGLIPATLGLANLAYAAVLFGNARKVGETRSRDQLPPV